LPGLLGSGRPPAQAPGSLPVALVAVHPAKGLLLIGGRAGDAIAVAKPFQEVAILAAAAAERRMLLYFGLAADRAAFGFRRFRHRRRRWGGRHRPATRPRRPPAAPALRAIGGEPRSRRRWRDGRPGASVRAAQRPRDEARRAL